MRKDLSYPRPQRRILLGVAVLLTSVVALAPHGASAEGLFDFFFGGSPRAQQQQRQAPPPQASFFADPFGLNQPPAVPQRPVASNGSGPAFCVRSCDGRYFPLSRANASPVQMCQAFCPATATKVFYGGNIENASSATGERYADSENAFAYRKELHANCTCNGRDPAGLAPVDLTLDSSLHSGDIIATTDGLVAYSGVRVGNNQTAEFTPVASYPGLTAEVRARLGEMKVAPVTADMIVDESTSNELSQPTTPVMALPKSALTHGKRAEAN